MYNLISYCYCYFINIGIVVVIIYVYLYLCGSLLYYFLNLSRRLFAHKNRRMSLSHMTNVNKMNLSIIYLFIKLTIWKKKKSNFTCYFNESLWGINFLFKRYFFIGIILNFNFPFKKIYVTNNSSLHAEAITHSI